jgi:hypothetical protein
VSITTPDHAGPTADIDLTDDGAATHARDADWDRMLVALAVLRARQLVQEAVQALQEITQPVDAELEAVERHLAKALASLTTRS